MIEKGIDSPIKWDPRGSGVWNWSSPTKKLLKNEPQEQKATKSGEPVIHCNHDESTLASVTSTHRTVQHRQKSTNPPPKNDLQNEKGSEDPRRTKRNIPCVFGRFSKRKFLLSRFLYFDSPRLLETCTNNVKHEAKKKKRNCSRPQARRRRKTSQNCSREEKSLMT